MSKQVRLRRGTTVQHASFTGADGELTYDTTMKVLRVHDGVTPGGKVYRDAIFLSPEVLTDYQQLNSPLKVAGNDGFGYGLEVSSVIRAVLGLQVDHGGSFVNSGSFLRTIFDLTYAATVDINFNSYSAYRLALTGNVTFTSSNALSGLRTEVFVSSDASARTLTFPGAWRWLGSMPASLAANKVALLELVSILTVIWARWSVEP